MASSAWRLATWLTNTFLLAGLFALCCANSARPSAAARALKASTLRRLCGATLYPRIHTLIDCIRANLHIRVTNYRVCVAQENSRLDPYLQCSFVPNHFTVRELDTNYRTHPSFLKMDGE